MKNFRFLPFLVGIVFMLGFSQSHGQDPQYTMFYANQVYLNPAFTGAALGPRVAMGYRSQWVSIPGHYRQFVATYDQPVEFGRVLNGWGVTLASDVAGEGSLTKLDALFNYSIAIPLTASWKDNQQFLRFGLSGGFQQATIDFFKLRFSDQIDPREGFIYPTGEYARFGANPSYFIPDVNAGLAWYNKYAWVAASAHHITQPEQVLADSPPAPGVDATLPMRITATAGASIPLSSYTSNREILLSPVVMYRQQRTFSQIDVGAYVTLEPVLFGLWYRHQDAVAAMVGFKEGIFSVGYSYDYTISSLTNSISGGSHEIALVMEFERNKPLKFKHKKMPCPRF